MLKPRWLIATVGGSTVEDMLIIEVMNVCASDSIVEEEDPI